MTQAHMAEQAEPAEQFDERFYRKQPNGNILVFDIETVSDNVSEELKRELFSKIEPTKEVLKKGDEAVKIYIENKKEEIESEFALSPMTGRIDGIGIYVPDNTGDYVDASYYLTYEDEGEILRQFNEILVKTRPTLISFNGKNFDAHFIKVRASKFGIHLGFDISTKRYATTPHFDVREVLTNFGAIQKGTLRQWALFYGMTPPENDGSEIGNLSAEKRAEKCLKDCEITYNIYNKIKNLF